MENIQQLLHSKRDEVARIAARHGAHNVRVFGSVARGEARSDSDIDLLVAVDGPTTPWFPAGLILDLEALLARRIEIVTEQALNPELRERVLNEAQPV